MKLCVSLEKLLGYNKFDFIVFEHLHFSYYGKLISSQFKNMNTILFHHNIETDLYFSFFKNSSFFQKKPYFLLNFY